MAGLGGVELGTPGNLDVCARAHVRKCPEGTILLNPLQIPDFTGLPPERTFPALMAEGRSPSLEPESCSKAAGPERSCGPLTTVHMESRVCSPDRT